eukprot:365584-Chlamydomonas_euryale.AAC.2
MYAKIIHVPLITRSLIITGTATGTATVVDIHTAAAAAVAIAHGLSITHDNAGLFLSIPCFNPAPWDHLVMRSCTWSHLCSDACMHVAMHAHMSVPAQAQLHARCQPYLCAGVEEVDTRLKNC